MTERVELVAAFAVFIAVAYALMWRGWRSRQQRQSFLPPPVTAAPGASVLVEPVPGLLVGTSFAGRWMDRVNVHGLSHRSIADLTVAMDGVHLVPETGTEVFVPFADVVTAEPGSMLAGKVMGEGGLLLLTWHLGGTALTTGFRADQHAQHQRLADAITAHLPAPTTVETA